MPTLLARIEEERAALARLLAILDKELDQLREPNSDPDYRLIHDIVHYCHVYPPLSLFRYEDSLFAYLAEHDPDWAALAATLRSRHARHAKLAAALYEMLEGVLSGHLIPRERLLKEAAAYVKLHRDHIASREAKLLSAVTAELSADALAALDARHQDTAQPPIPPTVDDEYTRLRADIEAAAQEA